MKIRTKSIIVFLVLSLVPLAVIGLISYKNGEEAIKRNLGSGFQQVAHGVIDKVNRNLNDVYHSVWAWAELGLMQEVITSDMDGKISSFLMGISKEYRYFSSIDVVNKEGEVVASSNLELINQNFKEEDFYKNVIEGKPYVEDVHLDEVTKEWVVTFSFPIKAKFEEGKIIGVLSAKWKASELFTMIQLKKKEAEEEYHTHLMLMRGDGMVIAAPESEKEDIFKRNLIKAGLTSALLASQGKEGYLVETDEHNRKSLIGYEHSRGYGDFSGLGWFAFVVEDVRIAFAPIERLKIIIFGMGAIVALLVIIISLTIAHGMTAPILKISQAASQIAHGNFEAKVDYASGDEIGFLSRAFNQMVQDLKEHRVQLVEKDYVDSIIASVIDTLIVLDSEGAINRVNKETLDLLGYREGELIGKDESIILPEGKRFKELALENPLKKDGIKNYEIDYKTKDGRWIPILASASPLSDKDGKAMGIVIIGRDITERKKAEEHQKLLLKDLEDMNKIMVGRELKMIEFKREINRLNQELGREKPYKEND